MASSEVVPETSFFLGIEPRQPNAAGKAESAEERMGSLADRGEKNGSG